MTAAVLVLPFSGFDDAAQLPWSWRGSFVLVLASHSDWCLRTCPLQPYQDLLLPESHVAFVLFGMSTYDPDVIALTSC